MSQVTAYRAQATVSAAARPVWHWVLLLLFPVTCILIPGCASSPPPPDWKINARDLLEGYAKHYLNGDSKLAGHMLTKARAEISRTGRPDLMARAELTRCAVHAAALDLAPCHDYERLAGQASAEDAAYARFLGGEWAGLEERLLPQQYRRLLKADNPASLEQAINTIDDPLSRGIAAAVLFKAGRATPGSIASAVANASDQGWRRPLLAWLGVQAERAEAAGDATARQHIRQRIDLILSAGGLAP